jgi:type IV fimbrial biogenesis protein FimT
MLVTISKYTRAQVQQQLGFTLPELIVTLAIAAILMTLVVPAFTNFTQQTRLIVTTNELVSAMNLARMEAIKRNGRVDLIAHNGSWKNGWKITADNQIIFNHEALHEDIRIDSTFPNKTKPYIAYSGTGRTRTDANSHAALSGTLRISIGDHVRLIVVNFLGRIRTCNPATEAKNKCSSAALEESALE